MNSDKLHIDEYDYHLPDDRIALYPSYLRDESKLLVFSGNRIQDSTTKQLADYLEPGMLMVFNNSRVIRARLQFQKPTGALIEVFCLEPLQPLSELQTAMQQKETATWKCLVGNAARWKSGALLAVLNYKGQSLHLSAEICCRADEAFHVNFKWAPTTYTFSEVLEAAGKVPLPPYIKREAEALDIDRYQTVYAKCDGSVAAPTAGMHFTPDVFRSLTTRGINTAEVTLHVGAGTFRPVLSGEISDHKMHQEQARVDVKFIEQLYNAKDKILAVGTTSVRTLESLYFIGQQIIENGIPREDIGQWEPYCKPEPKTDRNKILEILLKYLQKSGSDTLEFHTGILIMPSYKFRMTDGMLTNFHQPRSTLLLLIAAYLGDDWKKIYHHALKNNYRFLSYGDACLFLK